MKAFLYHDGTFGVMLVLGIAALAFLIYLSITMSKKHNDKKRTKKDRDSAKSYMFMFSILSAVLGLFLIVMTYDHFKHRNMHKKG